MHRDEHRWKGVLWACVCVHLWLLSPVHAAWFDQAWPFRRPVDVTWDAERSNGEDLAYVEFYAVGRNDDAGDIRIATEDGRPVASDVLQAGPGDRVRAAFALQKGQRKYFVYWGNPDASPAEQKLEYRRGMLLEMKAYPGGAVNNFEHLTKAFDRAPNLIGRTVVEKPFLGNNVLGEQQQTLSRLTGQLFVPMDGQYTFALAADDRGALLIDGKILVWAHGAPGDTRFNKTVQLKRGPHAMTIYHCDLGGDYRLSVGWKRPDSAKFEIIGRDSLGYPFPGQAGALEERNKTLVADFSAGYEGECWYAERISHHYRFTGTGHKSPEAKFEWDFGDGQSARGRQVDHVFLSDGVYPIKVTIRLGGNSDTRTVRFVVHRQFEKLAKPTQDRLTDQSRIVAGYDLNTLPAGQLARAVFMHHRARNWDAMRTAAAKLAGLKKSPEPESATAALLAAADALHDRGGAVAVEKLWASVPAASAVYPRALREHARVLMWGLGDFKAAVAVLSQPNSKDNAVRRMLGMALVLNGRVDEGAKILHELPEQGEPEKRAAISGAMARTIEFFIDEKDPDAGDDHWDRWQSRYPADFLLGYSVLLKVRLIELRRQPAAAARLAEAFAQAVPHSSYAPQLLDRASKLLADSDAKHSGELRKLLKQRYPEDPLAQ